MTGSALLVREHTAPNTVHALTFSPDGALFAFASGHEEGQGRIGCIDESGKVRWTHDDERITYHGLCFDQSGRHLIAAGFTPFHLWHPVHLFTIDSPEPEAPSEGEELSPLTVARPVRALHAPSALLHDGALVTHCTCRPLGRALNFLPFPKGFVESHSPQHLTSARVIVAEGALVTCAPDTPGESPEHASQPSRAILLARRDKKGALAMRQVVHPHQGRVTTLLMAPTGDTLVTGGEDGTIAFWNVTKENGDLPDLSLLALHHVHIAAIEAMCFLPGAGVVITVDRDGYMVLWRDHRVRFVVQIPNLSPKALAAHPREPRILLGGRSADGALGRIVAYDVGCE